jgi:polysaccharide deacetylase 2 family uncharacterized protein YibQ
MAQFLFLSFLRRGATNVFAHLAFVFLTATVAAADDIIYTADPEAVPAISIIIDDLGHDKDRDERVIRLPVALSYSFLPHTRHATELAELAHHLGKDVLLHLPMQSIHYADTGPGGLTMEMSRGELLSSFRRSLAAVPHAVGINNHMGSLLTQHPGHMQWLMQAISRQGDLFFVDSFTVATSVAHRIATEHWVPNMKRDVFLDNQRSVAAIDRQFQRLLRTAQDTGLALAIAHPYPETLKVLERRLPALESQGIRLIPVSQLIDLHTRRFRIWRAYLSL